MTKPKGCLKRSYNMILVSCSAMFVISCPNWRCRTFNCCKPYNVTDFSRPRVFHPCHIPPFSDHVFTGTLMIANVSLSIKWLTIAIALMTNFLTRACPLNPKIWLPSLIRSGSFGAMSKLTLCSRRSAMMNRVSNSIRQGRSILASNRYNKSNQSKC